MVIFRVYLVVSKFYVKTLVFFTLVFLISCNQEPVKEVRKNSAATSELRKNSFIENISLSANVFVNEEAEVSLPSHLLLEDVSVERKPSLGKLIKIDSARNKLIYKAESGIGYVDTLQFIDVSAGQSVFVSVSFNIINRAPVAESVIMDLTAEETILVDFKASDPDGDKLSVVLPETLPEGVKSWSLVSGALSVSIQLESLDIGFLSFRYSVSDSRDQSAYASVNLTFIELPNADFSTMVNSKKSFQLDSGGLEGDTYIYELLLDEESGLQISNFDPNTGTFDFTPPKDFVGDLDFSYSVNNGLKDLVGYARISVKNNSPQLKKQSFPHHMLNSDIATVALEQLAFDKDGHELSLSFPKAAKHGTISYDAASKSISYSADATFVGELKVPYLVSDPYGGEVTGELVFIICQRSKAMAIWSDKNEDGLSSPFFDEAGQEVEEDFIGLIRNFSGSKKGPSENYGRDNNGDANLTVGPKLSHFQSHIFFVEDLDGAQLNLYMVHNAPFGGGTNAVNWDILVTGNEGKDSILVYDDVGEISAVEGTATLYKGAWTYYDRTDGAVIGPLSNNKASIGLKFENQGSVDHIGFYSADGHIIYASNYSSVVIHNSNNKIVCK